MTEPGDLQASPPTEPPAGGGERPGNPWEQRARLGFVPAFLETLKLFITSPTAAFASTRTRGDFGSPLVFALILAWLAILVGHLWSLLLGGSILSMFPSDVREQAAFFLVGQAGGLLFALVFAPIFIIIGLFLWSGILHLCLIIVGGLGQSESGFEGTFRAISYAAVAQLANLIPAVGGLICAIWSLVLVVIGFQQLHNTSQNKAIAAVVIPILFCCLCLILGLVVAGAGIFSMWAQS